MKLRAPTPADEAAVMDFRREFQQHGERLLGAAGLENYENYFEWLQHVQHNLHAQTTPAGLAPSSLFLCCF